MTSDLSPRPQVVLCGPAGDVPVTVEAVQDGFQVTSEGRTLLVADSFNLAQPVITTAVDGQPEIVQLLRRGVRGDATLRWDRWCSCDTDQTCWSCLQGSYITL